MPTVDRQPLLESNIPDVKLWRRGKVRDVYDLGDRLLIVATDRISAFDVILPTGIPDKGVVLTQISLFWFKLLEEVVPNHVVTSDVGEYDPVLRPYRDQLEGRSMIVRKTEPLPVEAVVRGYITGSGWKEYKAKGSVCGIPLPAGLRESDRLDPAIFTPSTKAEVGHDENITFAEVEKLLGPERAAQVRDVTLSLYHRARAHTESRGIILADTKFEFGIKDGRLIWIDEALTPDSSRFWPQDSYEPGRGQPSFDKQYVRDYLEGLSWDKQPPGPALPERRRLAHAGEVPRGVSSAHRARARVTPIIAAQGGAQRILPVRPFGCVVPPGRWPRGLIGSVIGEATARILGRRDDRQRHPLFRRPPRVREAVHPARPPAPPRATCRRRPRISRSTATPSDGRSKSSSCSGRP